jgi:hypothetical protein
MKTKCVVCQGAVPACRKVVPYDAGTWGNYYTGPGCGVKYVCPKGKGKGEP